MRSGLATELCTSTKRLPLHMVLIILVILTCLVALDGDTYTSAGFGGSKRESKATQQQTKSQRIDERMQNRIGDCTNIVVPHIEGRDTGYTHGGTILAGNHLAWSFLRRIFEFHARVIWLLTLGILSGLSAAAEHLQVQGTEVVAQSGGIGVFDSERKDYFLSIELRLAQNWRGIRPWGGISAVESGSWFCGAGFIYDWRFSGNCRLTIGSGPFYYQKSHDRYDLGFAMEFYSFLELTRECGRRDGRVGLRLGHLSNAGLGRKNPGTETLAAVVSFPVKPRK